MAPSMQPSPDKSGEPANPLPVRVELALKDRALAATAEGVTIADSRLPDNPLIYANAGFERLTGYSVQEVLGRNCRFLQGPETDPKTTERLRAAIREKREITVTLLNYRKDGTRFWNRLSITPVRDEEGNVTHFIGIQSDVTEQKNAEEALQAAKTELEAAYRSMKRDLEAAARVQQLLLPLSLPTVPGVRFGWACRPCRELAGDSLNVLPLDDHTVGLYILDVSGHGVAAALLSVTLAHLLAPSPERSVLYKTATTDRGCCEVASPAQVVTEMNRQFPLDPRSPQYFTMFYGVLDTRTHALRYVLAGHPGPIYLPHHGSSVGLEQGGLPAGLFPAANYREQVLELRPGDRLYLYTDGIIDAENPAEEWFGADRLTALLEGSRRLALEESVTAVTAAVEDWSGSRALQDDASMLALEITRPQ